MSAVAAASSATAGSMCRVWNAPATASGRSRAPAGGSAANAASSSMVPAATIWPAALTLAGVSPCFSMRGQHVILGPAEHRGHPGVR